MRRELVVTADDLGLTEAVNAAVAELAGHSALTATSLVTTGPVAQQALDLDVPLALGVHVVLPFGDVESMSDAQVEAAIESQVAWLLARGRSPRHLDLHTVGLYGLGPDAVRTVVSGVVPQAITVAARHGLALRLPRRPPVPGLSHARLELHDRLVRRADHLGVPLPETVVADMRAPAGIAGYTDLRDHVLDLVAHLPPGRSELILHPARPPAREGKAHWEDQLLRSGALARTCTAAGITLTHW